MALRINASHPISRRLVEETNYVHYYFRNFATYSLNSPQFNFDKFNSKKRAELLDNQINTVQARIDALVASTGAAGKALEELFKPESWNENLGEGYDKDHLASIKMSDKEFLNKSASYKNNDDAVALANQLAEECSTFVSSMNGAIDKMMGYLKSNKTVEDYRDEVIGAYAKNGTINGPIAQKIIDKFLSKDGLVELKAGEGATAEERLEADIKQCIAIVDAIEVGGFGDYIDNGSFVGDENSKAPLAAQIFRKFAGKIASMRSRAQGLMGEISAATALTTGSRKVFANIEELKEKVEVSATNVSVGQSAPNYSYGGACGIGCDIVVRQDPSMATKKLYPNGDTVKTRINKRDVEVTLDVKDGNGTASVTFGANVKNYTIDPSSKTMYYTIFGGGNTSFAEAYRLAFPQDSSFLLLANTGAGHTYMTKFQDKTTGKTLDAAWSEIVKTTVVSNLARYMMGSVNENTLFFVLNRQVYYITDVLRDIEEYIKNGEEGYNGVKSFGYGYKLNGISRDKMLKTSTWIKSNKTGGYLRKDEDTDLAIARSRKAYDSILGLLSSTRLTVSLKTLTSLITGKG